MLEQQIIAKLKEELQDKSAWIREYFIRIEKLEAKLKEKAVELELWKTAQRTVIDQQAAEIAEQKAYIAEMVRLAAATHRPAYDEQQHNIMMLHARIDTLQEGCRALISDNEALRSNCIGYVDSATHQRMGKYDDFVLPVITKFQTTLYCHPVYLPKEDL